MLHYSCTSNLSNEVLWCTGVKQHYGNNEECQHQGALCQHQGALCCEGDLQMLWEFVQCSSLFANKTSALANLHGGLYCSTFCTLSKHNRCVINMNVETFFNIYTFCLSGIWTRSKSIETLSCSVSQFNVTHQFWTKCRHSSQAFLATHRCISVTVCWAGYVGVAKGIGCLPHASHRHDQYRSGGFHHAAWWQGQWPITLPMAPQGMRLAMDQMFSKLFPLHFFCCENKIRLTVAHTTYQSYTQVNKQVNRDLGEKCDAFPRKMEDSELRFLHSM